MNYLYLGTVLFLIGCYGSLTWWQMAAYKPLLLALVIILLLAYFFKALGKLWRLGLCACFLLLGMWAGANVHPNPKLQLKPYFGQQVLAYGSIAPESVRRLPYGTSFILRCQKLQALETPTHLGAGLAADEATKQSPADNFQEKPSTLDYHQKLRVFTKYKELPPMGIVWCQGELQALNSLRNPGGFDGEAWNYLQGLGGRLRKTQVELVSNEGGFLDRVAFFNLHLREKIMSLAPGNEGALLCGMLLGGNAGLDDEVREDFAANGLAHLLSVSGTHFALLAGFLLLLLKPLPNKARKLSVLLLLCAYAVLCGMKPAIMRALCMSGVLLYGGSGAARGNLLCLTALVLLTFCPAWLLDVGFQLSFGAVAGLLWLYPKLKNYLCAYLPLVLGEAIALTAAAQLGVLPIVIAHFHQLPLISLISNVILVPILELATLLTILGVAFDFASLLSVSEGFIRVAAWLVEQVLVQAKVFAALPLSTVVIGSLPLWCAVVYYFALFIWADVPCLQFLHNRQRRCFLLAAGALLLGTLLWKQLVLVPMSVYFLDVGQGDCAVVVTPSKKVLVIDTGGLKNYDTGSRVLVPFLRSLGKTKVDALLLSHSDYDHGGGAAALARNMRIERIILPVGERLSEVEDTLLRNAPQSLVERARAGASYDFDGAALQIVDVPPSGNAFANNGIEASTVASIKYGRHSLLFTGDINASREALLPSLEEYDVLKVAHHGSRHSSSPSFLQQVRPKLAVISVGAGNGYGHPHRETLERLARVGSRVLRTDELGAVRITFSEEGMTCYGFANWVFQRIAF